MTRLVIDRQNRRLVNYLGSPTAVPSFFQSNTEDFQISVVDPSGNITSPYTLVDLNGHGLRLSVGATPTGTAGGPTPLALQDTWSWNSANKYFFADLALNTAAVDSFLGSAAQATAYMEVNLTISGVRKTIFQETFTLKAVVDELTSTSPAPVDSYLTRAESLALFAKLVGDLGQRIVFRSANGVYGRELGVDDDGSGIDNLITL